MAGTETYVIRARDDSLFLTSDFEFVDRGTRVPLKTTMALLSDLTPVRFETRGKTARRHEIDQSVYVSGRIALVRNGLSTDTELVSPPYFTIAA